MAFVTPRLEKLPVQPSVQKLLLGSLKERGSSTLLWVGPEGSGKRTHALALVRSLFCAQGPECPGCPSCKQVLAKTHPDLFWVHKAHFFADPEDSDYDKEMKKQGITVKVAQHLSRKLNRAPFSAPRKVAVIPDAEDLNPDAQNVLLKTLEEPPSDSLIILLCRATGSFLPTVLSRCRMVRFPALPDPTVEALLAGPYGWKKEDAQRVAREAGGNLTQALRSLDPEWQEFREKVRSDLDRALQGSDLEWLSLSQEYEKWEPGILEEGEKTATQRKAELAFLVFQSYAGIWMARQAGTEPIPAGLSSLPPDLVLKALQVHQDLLSTNLGMKMIMDRFFLHLRSVFAKGASPEKSLVETALGL